jgi:hypothetical protein
MESKTHYTKEKGEVISNLILEGKSLRHICKELGISRQTVCVWLDENPQFLKRYLICRELYCEFVFDEILEIADSPANDFSEVKKQQLQIDTRKWMLSKMNPKRYGKHLTLEDVSTNQPKQLVIVTTDQDVTTDHLFFESSEPFQA